MRTLLALPLLLVLIVVSAAAPARTGRQPVAATAAKDRAPHATVVPQRGLLVAPISGCGAAGCWFWRSRDRSLRGPDDEPPLRVAPISGCGNGCWFGRAADPSLMAPAVAAPDRA